MPHLLHLGVEVAVAVRDDELDGLVGDLLVRRLHGDAPDKVHTGQIQPLHALSGHKQAHRTVSITKAQARWGGGGWGAR